MSENHDSLSDIRVAVLDDHVVVRYGIELLVRNSPGYRWTGSACNAIELMALLAGAPCHVLVLDYQLAPGDLDGATLVRLLRARFPYLRILAYTSFGGRLTADIVRRAGAHGLIPKSAGLASLLEAVRQVAAGGETFPEGTPDGARPVVGTSGGASLSPRENEVLRCCRQGMTVTEIAEKFRRSVKTVSAQKQAGYRKLEVRSDHEFMLAYGATRPESGWQRA